jgi:hypothetical protein
MQTATPPAARLHYARMLIRSQRRYSLSISLPAAAPPSGKLRLVADNERHPTQPRQVPQRVDELAAA